MDPTFKDWCPHRRRERVIRDIDAEEKAFGRWGVRGQRLEGSHEPRNAKDDREKEGPD